MGTYELTLGAGPDFWVRRCSIWRQAGIAVSEKTTGYYIEMLTWLDSMGNLWAEKYKITLFGLCTGKAKKSLLMIS